MQSIPERPDRPSEGTPTLLFGNNVTTENGKKLPWSRIILALPESESQADRRQQPVLLRVHALEVERRPVIPALGMQQAVEAIEKQFFAK